MVEKRTLKFLIATFTTVAVIGVAFAFLPEKSEEPKPVPPRPEIVEKWLTAATIVEADMKRCAFETAGNVIYSEGKDCIRAFTGYQIIAKSSVEASNAASTEDYTLMKTKIDNMNYSFDIVQRVVEIETELDALDHKEFPEDFK